MFPLLGQKLRRFWLMWGFFPGVELHWEGSALQPAQQACSDMRTLKKSIAYTIGDNTLLSNHN